LKLDIIRTFDAPQALAFKVWSSAEHMARWLGPKSFTCTHCKLDFKPGGAWRACIRGPEGQEYWCGGAYREIAPNHRIVMTFAWDEDGAPGRETIVTVTFEAMENGKTRMNFVQTPFDTAANRDSHVEGWSECFHRLGAYLEAAA
jgi:uncharacterized protein YndB with AHSA1/START domain